MERKAPLDVATIAEKVLEALDPRDSVLYSRIRSENGNGFLDAPAREEPPTIEELAALVEELSQRLQQSRRMQELLLQQLVDLQSQIRSLPGHIVRLEQGNIEVEARLDRLGLAIEPHASVNSDAHTEASIPRALESSRETGKVPFPSWQRSDNASTRFMMSAQTTSSPTVCVAEKTPWLSVKDVAVRLNLSESTVRRYIREGILPAARLPGGRGLRLDWEEVVEKLHRSG